MKIKLNSNRNFMIKPFIPFLIIVAIILLLMSLSLIINFDEQKDCIPYLIALSVFELGLIIFILFAKLFKWGSYIFAEDKIVCFKRNKVVDTIYLSDIESMYYIKWKFQYIVTIIFGALNEGGCWKLHIKMKDGTKKELAFFSEKDIKLLKEKLYGELLNIQ